MFLFYSVVRSQALPKYLFFWPAGSFSDWLEKLRVWAADLVKPELERREAPRRMLANVTAHYWEGSGSAGHAVRDISLSGAFILADFQWTRGTILTTTLQLNAPGDDISSSKAWISVRSLVVRQVVSGIGIKFLYSTVAERKNLESFLERMPDIRQYLIVRGGPAQE